MTDPPPKAQSPQIQYSRKARPLPKSAFHSRSPSPYSGVAASSPSPSPSTRRVLSDEFSPLPVPPPRAPPPAPVAVTAGSRSVEAKHKEEADNEAAGAIQFQARHADEAKGDGAEATSDSLLRLASGATPIDPRTIPTEISAKCANRMVKSAAILFNRSSTSKINKFHPPVSYQKAIEWLQQQQVGDGTIVFEDLSSLNFVGGKYDTFEDLGDD